VAAVSGQWSFVRCRREGWPLAGVLSRVSCYVYGKKWGVLTRIARIDANLTGSRGAGQVNMIYRMLICHWSVVRCPLQGGGSQWSFVRYPWSVVRCSAAARRRSRKRGFEQVTEEGRDLYREIGSPSPPRDGFPTRDDRFANCGSEPREKGLFHAEARRSRGDWEFYPAKRE